MREIAIPLQGGGYKSVSLPSTFRTPFEAAGASRTIAANLTAVRQLIDSTIDPTDAIQMYDLMNNSNDRREARLLWQREAVLGALLETAKAEAVGASKHIGGIVLAAQVELSIPKQLR